MNYLFISVSSAGCDTFADPVKTRLGESSVLQQCGYHPFHLIRAEEFRNASFENHLQTIRHSRYMVYLLGQDEEAINPAFVDEEIEAALSSDVEIIAFCVGGACREEVLPAAIIRQCKKLPQSARIETIATDDPEVVARTVTLMMENEVLRVFGEDDHALLGTDLLSIPGFPADQIHTFPPEITGQLEKIYRTEDPEKYHCSLSCDVIQRKRWARESMAYGHVEAAISNLEKVHHEFGSDLFVCFWLGRLYTLYGSEEAQLNRGLAMSQQVLTMLHPAETLLFSLCHIHLGSAATKLGLPEQAGTNFDIAAGAFKTYEIHEFRAALCLQQMTTTQESRWLDEATVCLTALLRVKLLHYLSARSRLEDEYDGVFLQAEQRLLHKWESFAESVYGMSERNFSWASEHFYGFRDEPVKADKMQHILQCAMEIAQLNRRNYRILRQAAGQMQVRYEHVLHDLKELKDRRKKLEDEQAELTCLAEQSSQMMTDRDVIIEEEKALKVHEEKAEKHVFYSSCLIVLALVLMTFIVVRIVEIDMRQQDTLLFVLSTLFFFSLGLPYIFSGNYRKMKNQLGKYAVQRCTIKDDLLTIWRHVEPEALADTMRTLLAELKENPDSVSAEDLEQTLSEVHRYVKREFQRLADIEHDCDGQLEKLKELAGDWCVKVDAFEREFISADQGQYNYLLCRCEQVQFGENTVLDVESVPCRYLKSHREGLVLYADGSRMKAWFTDAQSAGVMMDDLCSTGDSPPAQVAPAADTENESPPPAEESPAVVEEVRVLSDGI